MPSKYIQYSTIPYPPPLPPFEPLPWIIETVSKVIFLDLPLPPMLFPTSPNLHCQFGSQGDSLEMSSILSLSSDLSNEFPVPSK